MENVALFPHRRNCNSEFYYFWADSSGIVLKSPLFLKTADWWLFVFSFNCNEPTVFCWLSCPRSLFVSSLSSGLASLVFQSVLSFSFTQSFWNFSLCDQLFLFLLTTLWRMGCLHISYIALESDLSLDQTVVGSWLVSFWMCEVNNTGSATTRILLSRTLMFGVATLRSGPTGSYYPGGFSTAEE